MWRQFDFLLLAAMLVLAGLGLAMIESATRNSAGICPGVFGGCVNQQIAYGVIGLAILLVGALVDYRIWGNVARMIYLFNLFLLALVLVVGSVSGGSKGWFQFGLFRAQPAELAKVLLIITLAKYLADHDMRQMRHLLTSLVLLAIPAGLIFLEPDLGIVTVLVAIWLGMIFIAGARLWHMGLLGLAGVLGLPLALPKLPDYMVQRIVLFLDPQRDPTGAGYNIRQALIAVGSGGWMGRGYGSGSQSQLHFLLTRHTDYIFSVIGEELGFVGTVLVFVLFMVLILRILRNGSQARDTYGRLMAVGVAMMFTWQSVVNIAVNIGLMPVTGLTLPFISYGGSSLLTLMLALGLVESIALRRKKAEMWGK